MVRPKATNGRRDEKIDVRVQTTTKARFDEFFAKYGEPGADSDRIRVLLDLAKSNPDLVLLTKDRLVEAEKRVEESLEPPMTKRRRPETERINGDYQPNAPASGDNDIGDGVMDEEAERGADEGQWEDIDWENGNGRDTDEADTLGGDEDSKPIQVLAPNGQMVWHAPRLLTKGYYKRFSRAARHRPCSVGHTRTIAQMANCRRMIVEKRCLVQLLEHSDTCWNASNAHLVVFRLHRTPKPHRLHSIAHRRQPPSSPMLSDGGLSKGLRHQHQSRRRA